MAGGETGILLTLASEGGFGEPLQGLASLERGLSSFAKVMRTKEPAVSWIPFRGFG